MTKEIWGIELNNGAMVVKYGDKYAHYYDSAYYCSDQIFSDIQSFQVDPDTSYWDGNDPYLLRLFDGRASEIYDILDVEEILNLLRSFEEVYYYE